VARGDLATAFHEAGHVAAAWSRGLKVHSATIVPTPGFRGHTLHANPLRESALTMTDLHAPGSGRKLGSLCVLPARKRSGGLVRAPGARIMARVTMRRPPTWF
jgi:hypothetical protein